MTDDARPDPQEALRELIGSEGYRLLLEQVRLDWGAAAVNRKIKAALAEVPPSEHSATVQAILGTAESIVKLFAWPEEEIDRLRDAANHHPGGVDRFAAHRRMG